VFGDPHTEGHRFDSHRDNVRVMTLQLVRNETGALVSFHLRKGAFVLLVNERSTVCHSHAYLVFADSKKFDTCLFAYLRS
jgi:hypothetical protein